MTSWIFFFLFAGLAMNEECSIIVSRVGRIKFNSVSYLKIEMNLYRIYIFLRYSIRFEFNKQFLDCEGNPVKVLKN